MRKFFFKKTDMLDTENNTTINQPLKNLSTETGTRTEHPILEIIRFTLIALIIVIPIRMFIAQPFIVLGASMENTFHTGEYLIVDQISYYFHPPRRGDVIVFRYPRDPSKFFIKRVIGLPNETVIIDGSKITIKNKANPNGVTINEPYIKTMTHPNHMTEMIGENEYFVMGDNRDKSSDSRTWGLLPRKNIIGHVFLRLFPPAVFNYLPGKTTYFNITQTP